MDKDRFPGKDLIRNGIAGIRDRFSGDDILLVIFLSAVIIMAFILAGFQFIITNIQTLASDFYTGKTVGSLTGLGGAAAVLGIIISIYFVPFITAGGNWFWFFMMGASLVPLSLASVLFMSGRIEQVKIGKL